MKKNLYLTDQISFNENKKPILLLGDWLINRKNYNFFNSRVKTCDPEILDRESIKSIYNKCNRIYISIISDLAEELQRCLDLNYSLRAWKIILGNWLIRLIWIWHEKFFYINHVLKRHGDEIDKIYSFNTKNYSIATEDTYGILIGAKDVVWNNAFYNKILSYLNVKFEIVLIENKKKSLEYENFFELSKNKNYKIKLIELISNLINKIRKNKNFLIDKTYLPFEAEKKLEIMLNEWPSFYNVNQAHYKNIDINFRNSIDLKKDNLQSLETFIRKILPESLPTSIIESANSIIKNLDKTSFPKNPKAILTSNSYDFDEVFKFYTAKNVDAGCKYYVGQHGGTYFVDMGSNFRNEIDTSDKFFSWGYKSNNKKIIPLFNIKTFKKKRARINTNGNLTMILRSLGQRVQPHERHNENMKLIDSTLEITKNLKDYKNNIFIKFHNSFLENNLTGTSLLKNIEYFKTFNNSFKSKFDSKSLNKTKLFLFNYNSTGILENLSLNIPTVCFWNDTFKFIDDEALEKYQLLIEANILFKDTVSLTNHIKKNWLTIDQWWLSEKTQSIIHNFNKNFNITAKNDSLNLIKKKLENNLN